MHVPFGRVTKGMASTWTLGRVQGQSNYFGIDSSQRDIAVHVIEKLLAGDRHVGCASSLSSKALNSAG